MVSAFFFRRFYYSSPCGRHIIFIPVRQDGRSVKKKSGLPLFVLVINNIYSILKRVVQAVVGAMYRKLSQYLESNRSDSVVFARLCLSCFIY